MKRVTFAFFLQLNLISVFPQDSIEAAYRAYRDCSYERSESIYSDIWSDLNQTVENRQESGRKLAYLYWKVDQDIMKVREVLDPFINIGNSNLDILLELSEYECEARNFDEAITRCEQARDYATDARDIDKINVSFSKILLAKAVHQIENGLSTDKSELRKGLALITAINTREPGQLEVNEIQLGLALLLKEGEFILKAWRGYFRIPYDSEVEGILSNPGKSIDRVSGILDENGLSKNDREALILALAGSRFYNYAWLVSTTYNPKGSSESQAISEMLNYYHFCRSLNSLAADYNRQISKGNLNNELRNKFYSDLKIIENRLWIELDWYGEPEKFTDQNFKEELYNRFGTIFKDVKPYYTSMGKSGLFLLAHTVDDRILTVEQYGYTSSIHYVSLDFMYGNSYDGWFLGSKTGRLGGWSEKSLIVKMRRAYSDKPVTIWEKISEPEARRKWMKEINNLSDEDLEKSHSAPLSYFPGMINRMQFDVSNELLNTLTNSGYEGQNLKIAFISSFETSLIQSAIECHEGRHVIDNTFRFVFEPFSRDYEYRAKLSELIYSVEPRFTYAFSSIYSGDLFSKSKHSRARLKIVTKMSDWIENHQDEIVGFDPTKVAMIQIDLLSDDQLVSAFQSMDPLFKKRGGRQ